MSENIEIKENEIKTPQEVFLNPSSIRVADLYIEDMMMVNFRTKDGNLVESRFISPQVILELIEKYFNGDNIQL